MTLSKSQIKQLKEFGENIADKITDYVMEEINFDEIVIEANIKKRDEDKAYGIIWGSIKRTL